MIAAHGWCCHFLRIGHTEFGLWRDPYAFLTSVAFQMLAAFGDAIFPESVAIDVKGRIHDVSTTGVVAGVDIERYVALPWRRERLTVDLDVRRIAGDATGVRIGELVENYRSVPLSAFRELAWFEPLRHLRVLQPSAHVTLWIDGLDEDHGGAIGAVLPHGSECRRLGNATLIISSRPGAHLDRFVEDGAESVELNASALAADNARVLMALIDRELADPKVTEALAASKWPIADVRAGLVGASEGNFLFIRQYFEAVRSGLGAALREGGLPHGLDAIHARILSTMARGTSEARRPDVLRLLEVLAVAQVPISVAQLTRLAGVTEVAVKEALQVLRPVLDETTGEPVTFSCYHKSLRDCLVSARHAGELWRVDAEAAHLRIATAYFDAEGTASHVDGYGVIHGATHLAQAGAPGATILFALLHEGWRRFCREVMGSNRPFHEALDLARQCARRLPPAEACLRLIQFGLTDVYLRSAERQIPEDALDIMVRLGAWQRALDSVPKDLEAVEFARRCAAIIRGLLAAPPDPELAPASITVAASHLAPDHVRRQSEMVLPINLLKAAFAKLQSNLEWRATEMQQILDAWPLEKAEALWEVFGEIELAMLEESQPGAAILAACGRMRTVLNPAGANVLFKAAFDAVSNERARDRGRILERLLSAWAEFDPAAAREHLLSRGTFHADAHSAAGFMRLSLALERAGWPNSLAAGAQMLLALPDRPEGDRVEYAAVLLEIVRQAPGASSPETATQIIDRVEAILAEVRAARAASGEGTTPSAEEVALLISLAEVQSACKGAREEQALADAWQAVLDGGAVEDHDLRRLVTLQAAANRDLLEAYVNTAGEALGDRLWFSLLCAGVPPEGQAGSTKRLDSLLRRSEKPRATGWSFFYYGLANTCPLERLDWCEQLLRDVGVPTTSVVRWRLAMLKRLMVENRSEAGDWLRTTVNLWAEPKPNRNFVDELPGAIAGLPADLLAHVEAALPGIASRSQRRLLRAALARAMWTRDPARSAAWFDLACDEPPDAVDTADVEEVEEYVVLAFIAGQVRAVDAVRADALWKGALDRLQARLSPGLRPADAGYTHFCWMLRALHWGAPDLAISELAGLREPPPSHGARYVMFPFPSVSPFRVANLSESESLLGRAMVRASARHRQLVLDVLAQPLPPGGRSFALSQLAAEGAFPLAQRLAFGEQAVAAAEDVTTHPLRSLLVAEAAHSTAMAGAMTRALETARQAATMIEPQMAQGDTMISHAYASAFGRCIAVAIRCEAWETAWTWLEQGSALGMHGFHVMLAELPEATQSVAPISIDRFIEAESAGRNVYLTTPP